MAPHISISRAGHSGVANVARQYTADNRCCRMKHSASDRERLGQLSTKIPGGAAKIERLLQ